jgi:hypothetical protein
MSRPTKPDQFARRTITGSARSAGDLFRFRYITEIKKIAGCFSFAANGDFSKL